MNKEKIKIYLKWFIKKLAKWTIKRYQPGVIAITGSVGKTSTKEAIYAVLKNCRSVRATKGNFNNEIGLPLTILGDYQKIESKFFWVKVILISLARLIIKMKYPEILILEYAADKPGDMKYLLEIGWARCRRMLNFSVGRKLWLVRNLKLLNLCLIPALQF
ncbi:MAG: UDP-N-acetylmuramoyl-tripeptide--D-alanyl-D-alanine ligase [Parcubacteria group bacterium Athens1014_26]|nr:MAG: UDP-N-acetylmuramoyl-tripeptide--D-alanyl-D-alanine ligase [Parcubacteria group bacterium Athens1014_26]